MDYKEKYEQALERAKKMYSSAKGLGFNADCINLEVLFPELKEIEGEEIRKALCKMVNETASDDLWTYYDLHKEEALAWLEKQKTSESALQYLKESHSPSEVSDFQAAMNIAVAKAYDKGYNDALEKQGEQKSAWSEEDEKILRWVLDDLLRLFNIAKKSVALYNIETDWLKSLKTKCKGAVEDNKIEPKFKVGDFIVSDYCMGRVIEVTNDAYLLDNGQGISFPCDSARLWDVTKDAKDGDVLVESKEGALSIIMFKKIGKGRWDNVIDYHCYYNQKEFSVQSGYEYWSDINNSQLTPATKEQRDLLFQKMEEAGYTWNEKELKLEKLKL